MLISFHYMSLEVYSKIIEVVRSHSGSFLYSKVCSPPYCCAVLLDPRITHNCEKVCRQATQIYTMMGGIK